MNYIKSIQRGFAPQFQAKSPWRLVLGLLGSYLLAQPAHAAYTLETLFTFDGTNGAIPEATLVLGADGCMYGTTMGGGTNGTSYGADGTIFRVTTNGTVTTVVFLDRAVASGPQAGLVQHSDGNLYGTTFYGGPQDWGAAFKLKPDGTFAVLTSFTWPDAEDANGLVEGSDGALYGTAYYGGTNGGEGSIFKIATDGTLTPLVSFGGTNGANPQCALHRGKDGNFYGTTVNGGTNGGWGTIFKMTPEGALTSFFSFNGTNGAAPLAAPVQTADGCLYGTTGAGGNDFDGTGGSGLGTIYRLTPDGTFTTLVCFGVTNGGRSTFSGLLLGADGNFYGTTEQGGAFYQGTVFKVTTNGLLTTLASFNSPGGTSPSAGLVQAPDGNLYGVTMSGGEYDLGTVFRLRVIPDAIWLRAAPEPGGRLELSWNAVAGQQYQVQYRTGLEVTNWQDWGTPLNATNSEARISDSLGTDQHRFYRVKLVQ